MDLTELDRYFPSKERTSYFNNFYTYTSVSITVFHNPRFMNALSKVGARNTSLTDRQILRSSSEVVGSSRKPSECAPSCTGIRSSEDIGNIQKFFGNLRKKP